MLSFPRFLLIYSRVVTCFHLIHLTNNSPHLSDFRIVCHNFLYVISSISFFIICFFLVCSVIFFSFSFLVMLNFLFFRLFPWSFVTFFYCLFRISSSFWIMPQFSFSLFFCLSDFQSFFLSFSLTTFFFRLFSFCVSICLSVI